jgi:predicted nucleic acid-binding protein
MVYIDTSSLLKTLWLEPESAEVGRAIAAEKRVVISSLTELETEIQLHARWVGGGFAKAKYLAYRKAFEAYRETAPFEFHALSGSIFSEALRQHRASGKVRCRTLDRLHLSAMEELGVRRLVTNDARQAEAAIVVNYEVLVPRGEVPRS